MNKSWSGMSLALVRERVDALSRQSTAIRSLKKIKRGLEKESLRVTPDGQIALTPHPAGFGSALTHPNITTDYSEALLEFITPPFMNGHNTLSFLKDIHAYSYQYLNSENEMLWVNSMPCKLPDDDDIPIAYYGTSNSAKMKSIYRVGLGHRYGRTMQTIAGIHYNFSLPDLFWEHYHSILEVNKPLQTFIDEQYFKLIRNFQRLNWIPVYLFGASPMICNSFISASTSHGRALDIPSALTPFLPEKIKGTSYLPDGTSLRMSSLGYHNSVQADLHICYNSLDSYIDSLENAIHTPSPLYEAIGLYRGDERVQLNSNILQIENEFYNSIRPKRNSQFGERPTIALKNRGVEYVEVRLLDLDPFAPGGISEQTIDFMDIFLLFSLMSDSPQLSANEQAINQSNLQMVVNHGRNPNTLLISPEKNEKLTIADYFAQIYPLLEPIAQMLDDGIQTSQYSTALANESAKFSDPSLTPSYKIVNTLQERELNFFSFAMERAEYQKNYFLESHQLSDTTKENFKQISALSIKRQLEMETNDSIPLEQFIDDYLTQK